MPTKSCLADKSSLFAVTGSTELGGGADRHLTIGGPWNGYTFTSAVRCAFDWSDVRRITSATLLMRTSAQVHVGFSSSPDFYVARATADWTANGSSSSSEGGSGWGTSPTVYPGPPSTSTGRVSKRAPTTEGTNFGVDITAIVRAWAPTTVEGGGAQPNYGVVLSRVASGDVTEVASYREPTAAFRPSISLVYETDTPPPAPTVTAPTSGQIVTSVRPTLAATCVDPDGDPLTNADVEVKKAGAVVWSNVGFVTGVGATTITVTPTADLPPGDLTVRFRAKAAGVYGAWSAESPFTIDRLPVVTGWTSPPATVSGNRRPALAFTTTDADADPLELYDVRVYADMGGGVPSTDAVYFQNNQSATFSGSAGSQAVSHTPTADLPPGALLARSRVRSRGVWSAWSAYRPFVVVVAVPAVTVIAPASDGGFVVPSWVAPPTAIDARGIGFSADIRPPSGQTLTKVHHRLLRLTTATADPGDVLDGIGSYEDPTGAIPGWTPTAMGSGGRVSSVASSTVGDGARALAVVGDGVAVSAGALSGLVAAVKGGAYTLKAYGCRVTRAPTGAIVRLETLPPDRSTSAVVQTLTFVNSSPMVAQTAPVYTVPADGSVGWLRVRVMYTGVLPLADEYRVDAVTLTGPRSGWYIEDVDLALQPAGGVYARSFTPPAMGFAGLYGVVQSEWTATASNAGVTGPVVRRARFSIGEWLGSLALGDSASDLAIPTEASVGDVVAFYYRAQSSPTAANGSAPWRTAANIAAVSAELPTTNAYLGVDVRIAAMADDADLVTNGSFEDGVGSSPVPGWNITTPLPGSTGAFADATAVDGARLVRVQGNGTGTAEMGSYLIPVVPGATYRLTAYAARFNGANNARVRVDARRADQSAVAFGVISLTYANVPPLVSQTGVYTVPADGSVVYLGVVLGFQTQPAAAGEVGKFDAVSLVGPGVGGAGADKLCISWKSLG